MGSAFRAKDCERRSREAGDKLKREKYRFCGAERRAGAREGFFQWPRKRTKKREKFRFREAERGEEAPREIFLTAAKADDVSGDDSKEDPPVPIPNTEVKLFRVDDTWRATAWESRTLPEYEGETVPDGSQAQVFLFRRRKGKMILK